MTVRAVLFDAGNTLLGLDHERIAPAVAEALDVPLTAAALRAASPRAALAMEEGRSSDQERALRYLKLLFEYAGVPASRIDEVNKVLWPLHAEQNLWSGVEPGTAPALERLQVAGYRLGVSLPLPGRVLPGHHEASGGTEPEARAGHLAVDEESADLAVGERRQG
ncbi:MAG TPA: hypothetical protein VG712_01570, partial [Gemmatimonadales bacterium]|nr:hypothetical protein [Gemmatimonadales bacterium]